MSSSNDLNAIELIDDIENILFLCDRLNKRLSQVTTYVDEVKQTWISRRQTVPSDSALLPIFAQKATKCNKILLSVAEKLAVVELQTESLHSLQTSINNATLNNIETCPATTPTCLDNHSLANALLASTTNSKNNTTENLLCLQRDGFPIVTHSFNTTKNVSKLIGETFTANTSIQKQTSAFHRPASLQEINALQYIKPYSQKSINSQPPHHSLSKIASTVPSKTNHQGSTSHLTDSHSPTAMNEANTTDNKVRVKMQVISAGTVWRNADIPIVDHPSAFFVSNQDPRITEQFNMMSHEMNNYYNKSTNTAVPLQNISIGDFCVARFSEDNAWYRARVVLNNNGSVLIVFIDYGNSEPKSPNEIYPMIPSLARLPAMTVACTLNEVFPSNEKFWSSEATEAFNTVVKNRIVEVQFLQTVDQQWPLHFVKIILDGQSITQHPRLKPYITSASNEQIALHFNDKLTPMEYILYNVAVVESDIYNNNLPQ